MKLKLNGEENALRKSGNLAKMLQETPLDKEFLELYEARNDSASFAKHLRRAQPALEKYYGEEQAKLMATHPESLRKYLLGNAAAEFSADGEEEKLLEESNDEEKSSSKEDNYGDELKIIREMGFKEDDAELLRLLELFDGKVDLVILSLLSK